MISAGFVIEKFDFHIYVSPVLRRCLKAGYFFVYGVSIFDGGLIHDADLVAVLIHGVVHDDRAWAAPFHPPEAGDVVVSTPI